MFIAKDDEQVCSTKFGTEEEELVFFRKNVFFLRYYRNQQYDYFSGSTLLTPLFSRFNAVNAAIFPVQRR